MLKKNTTVALAILLTYSVICVLPTSGGTKDDKQARLTQKVKDRISRLGVGKDAVVEVKLRDNTRLGGYVSEAGADSFVVVDAKTGTKSTLAYGDVLQLKGTHRSTGAKVAIGVASAAAIALFIGFIWAKVNGF
jgi:hypothetical protein